MSEALGPMVYGENDGEVFLGRSITTHKNVSEATMAHDAMLGLTPGQVNES